MRIVRVGMLPTGNLPVTLSLMCWNGKPNILYSHAYLLTYFYRWLDTVKEAEHAQIARLHARKNARLSLRLIRRSVFEPLNPEGNINTADNITRQEELPASIA